MAKTIADKHAVHTSPWRLQRTKGSGRSDVSSRMDAYVKSEWLSEVNLFDMPQKLLKHCYKARKLFLLAIWKEQYSVW